MTGVPRGLGGRHATHFAPAVRDDAFRVELQARLVSGNPVMSGVLKSAGGLLAILNERRQIVAVNDALLAELGLSRADELFGLRPGEAIHCAHANEMPGGCGTSESCSGCGAAIAIITALTEQKPVERDCVVTVTRGGREEELRFRVRSYPIRLGDTPFVLLFLRDITAQARHAFLEGVFLHDMANLIEGLRCVAVEMESPDSAGFEGSLFRLRNLTDRLGKEVSFQRMLAGQADACMAVCSEHIAIAPFVSGFAETVRVHPAARGRRLVVEAIPQDVSVFADPALLERVLLNMVINALEATSPAGQVIVSVKANDDRVAFSVWNTGLIPEPVARRVYQEHFSTKAGMGRGFGGYAMKLLGERYLGGTLKFTTSEEDGTTFTFTLPRGGSAQTAAAS